MRRARIECQHIGRSPQQLDNAAIQLGRCQGQTSDRSPSAIASRRPPCNECFESTTPVQVPEVLGRIDIYTFQFSF
jgi:hypothetical protein